jgi:hypothetical protein
MTHVYRISKGLDVGDSIESIESLKAFTRCHGPGRYHVDEHSLDPFPGTKVLREGVWQRDPSQGRRGHARSDSLAIMTDQKRPARRVITSVRPEYLSGKEK